MRQQSRLATAVVFVNFHSEALILPRATALLDQGFDVVVADNSDTFPDGQVRRVTMPANEGFSRACNRAVAALPPQVDAICFHNPDVDAELSVLDSLRGVLEGQRAPGAVAPAERNQVRVRLAGYHYPSPHREALLGGRAALATMLRGALSNSPPTLAPRGKRLSTAPRPTPPHRHRRFPSGGLLMVSRNSHEAIGGFDERYFLYGEDLDYWHRLGLAQLDTEFRPEMIIDHATSTGSPLGTAQRELLRWLGVELFAETFTPMTWRRMRLAHHLLLPAFAPACPELARRVAACWAADKCPSQVLVELRPFLGRRPAFAPGR